MNTLQPTCNNQLAYTYMQSTIPNAQVENLETSLKHERGMRKGLDTKCAELETTAAELREEKEAGIVFVHSVTGSCVAHSTAFAHCRPQAT